MTTIVTILTERYADWECALTMAAGRAYYGLNIVSATPGGRPVTSAGGLNVTPDMAIEDIDPDALDVLLVNGGATWEGDDAPDIAGLLNAVHTKGKTIGAICAATSALAKAGLLDQVEHTSNAPEFLANAKQYKGSAHYRNCAGAVNDDRIITAAGTAPVSFMKQIMIELGNGGEELDFYIGLHAAEHRQEASL